MTAKNVPLRMCTGCMTMKPKSELLRVVKYSNAAQAGNSANFCIDHSGKSGGRGAYICRDTSCLKKAKKARRFERAFRMKVPDNLYTELEGSITSDDK